MLQAVTFAHTDVLPSWFANVLARSLGLLAHGFAVTKADATHIQVPASADAGAAIVAIGGHFRYMEATVGPVAHPGGAAGTYPAFVTTKADVIVNSPVPYTDNTDYSFGLRLLAPGATPTIVPGTVDFYRHVADVVWDGAQIVVVRQIVPTRQTWPGELPVGAQVPYTGRGDPGTGEWMICDGRLIDSTAYSTFDATCGRTAPTAMRHAYNVGVDPGSNKVRIPDKRGKKSAGAINMGSTAGAGLNDNAHGQYVNGRSSGEVTHVLATGEGAPHTHATVASGGNVLAEIGATWATAIVDPGSTIAGVPAQGAGGSVSNQSTTGVASSSGVAHNNVDPTEADSWLVRVA